MVELLREVAKIGTNQLTNIKAGIGTGKKKALIWKDESLL
jgi:hypothetical protein